MYEDTPTGLVLELQTLSYLPDSRLPYVAAICQE